MAAPEAYNQAWGDEVERRLAALETEVFGSTVEPLVIPETLAYPTKRSTVDAGEGFFFVTSCLSSEDFDCGSDEVFVDEFTYMGHGMPYLYSEAVDGNHDHGWWVPGDREAYHCGYAFMYDKHPNPFGHLHHDRPGHFIARATIVRPAGHTYGRINDRYMEENQRFYDGSHWPGSNNDDQNCRGESLDDFDYDTYVSHGPDQIRVGLFRADGEIADIRDLTNKLGHYEFVSFNETRVTIGQLFGDQVMHVLYYDMMNDGRIAVEVNGTLIGG